MRRFVEPPNAACTSIAFSIASAVSTSIERPAALPLVVHGLRRAARDVEPDRLPRRGERGVRDCQPERLRDHLRRRGRAEELAAAARRRAGGAAEVGCLLERDDAVRESRAERLDGAGILADARRQRHPSGDDGAGELAERRDRHQHRGQALVAGADADDAPPPRQAAHEPPEDERGVVAVREGVEHPRRSLCPPVARIGHVSGERQPAEAVELLGGLAHEEADLPVSRVVPESDGSSRRRRVRRPASRG